MKVFPRRLLSYFINQCNTCGRIVINGAEFGTIIKDIRTEIRCVYANHLLTAIESHLQHIMDKDCFLCFSESLLESGDLSAQSKADLRRRIELVRMLYDLPQYQRVADRQRARLELEQRSRRDERPFAPFAERCA